LMSWFSILEKSCLGPLVLLLSKTKLFGFSNLSNLSVPDEDCSRSVSWAFDIYVFIIIHSCHYLIPLVATSAEDCITSIKHCAPRISSKMATIDEFVLKNIGLWWRYGISRHWDEWKYIIMFSLITYLILIFYLYFFNTFYFCHLIFN
jgi:hypothetical protein